MCSGGPCTKHPSGTISNGSGTRYTDSPRRAGTILYPEHLSATSAGQIGSRNQLPEKLRDPYHAGPKTCDFLQLLTEPHGPGSLTPAGPAPARAAPRIDRSPDSAAPVLPQATFKIALHEKAPGASPPGPCQIRGAPGGWPGCPSTSRPMWVDRPRPPAPDRPSGAT